MFPRINLLFADDIFLSLYLFLFWIILYRREKEKLCSKLSEPNWNNLMVRVKLLLELKYVGLAEVAVAPDLSKTNTVAVWLKLYWRTPRCRVSYFLISDQIIWTLYICISRKCIVNGKLYFLVKFSFREQTVVKFLQ